MYEIKWTVWIDSWIQVDKIYDYEGEDCKWNIRVIKNNMSFLPNTNQKNQFSIHGLKLSFLHCLACMVNEKDSCHKIQMSQKFPI